MDAIAAKQIVASALAADWQAWRGNKHNAVHRLGISFAAAVVAERAGVIPDDATIREMDEVLTVYAGGYPGRRDRVFYAARAHAEALLDKHAAIIDAIATRLAERVL